MEIKDFILKPVEDNNEAENQPKKRKNSVKYEIAIENESDFVINRKTTRGETSLVVIASQTPYQAYIKKGDAIETLTPTGYARFMSDYPEEMLPLTKPTWIDGLNRGSKFGENVIEYLNCFATAAKLGVGHCSEPSRDLELFCMVDPKLAVAVKDAVFNHYGTTKTSDLKEYTHRHFPDLTILSMIDAVYGLDNTRTYIKEVVSRGLISASGYNFSRLYEAICGFDLPRLCITQAKTPSIQGLNDSIQGLNEWKAMLSNSNFHFQFKRWLEYTLSYEREGYTEAGRMLVDWADDLIMQKSIFGKIKDKYPDNLKSHHDRLSVKEGIVKNLQEIKNIRKIGEDNANLECKINGNAFIVPKTTEEMVDEAIQQNNCLRSYIPRMAEGGCIIVFMRKAKEPEKSWITIELSPTLEVVQIKGRNNKEASPEALLTINKWAKQKGLTIRDCYSIAC